MSRDPYKYFRIEARDLLEQLEKGLLTLEHEAASPDLVPRLLRLAHTLKGAARVVKQPDVAELAHAVEDALAPLREQPLLATGERVDRILQLLDAIRARVVHLASPPQPGPVAAPQTGERLYVVQAEIEEMDALLENISQASIQIGSMRRVIRGVEGARHLADLLLEHLASPRTTVDQRGGNGSAARTKSLAEDIAATVSTLERSLPGNLDWLEREVRQVRDDAERLRLVPAQAVFGPLERVARDTAQAARRRATFEARGGDIRLDAHVLTGVQQALVQVVRNAVAHGIEPEAERLARGKPAPGRVALEVTRRGSRIVFACLDDGRGVDLEAVRQLAERKGMLSAATANLGAEELIQLLLRGGLSTSSAVTDMAGRGVGLDVVRAAVARLRGDVSVRTESGQGTVVSLAVPVSLTSLEALVVDAAGTTVAIPLDAARSTMRVRAEEIVDGTEGARVVYEGKAIPLIRLARCFGQARADRGPRAWSAVVVEGGPSLIAVAVDRLVGLTRLILQPLPALAPANTAVAGVWLDADGQPQVVLDPEGLAQAAARQGQVAEVGQPPARPPILVIDDSVTTRMLEQSILESAGYDVDLAVSGEQALEMARARRYAAFLVDIEMPGMDGFAFIERTRADPLLHQVPSILVTSRSSIESRRRGEQVGAAAYVAKSEFDQYVLLDTIRRLIV